MPMQTSSYTRIHPTLLLLPRAHAQGVKQSVCMSVVVVGTKIARSRVLGVYACYKHNQSVDTWIFYMIYDDFLVQTKCVNCTVSCIDSEVSCNINIYPWHTYYYDDQISYSLG